MTGILYISHFVIYCAYRINYSTFKTQKEEKPNDSLQWHIFYGLGNYY